MTEKPLSYDSLKTVLTYTDPNIRFLLATHAPSLRKTEKIVPLNIHYLSFDHLKMTINNTEYKFGTYRYYDTEVIHPRVLEDNQSGGTPYDIDEDGFEDEVTYNIITPGDVQIRGTLDQNLIGYIKAVKILERKNEKLVTSPMDLRHSPRPGSTHNGLRKKPFTTVQKQIKAVVARRRYKQKLNEFNLKHNPENIPKPTETFIRLTASHFGQNIMIERVKSDNKKLHDAEKYLATQFFGNRKPGMIYVKNFEIIHEHINIRLPVDLKFKIENFEAGEELEISEEELEEVLREAGHLE